MSATPAKKTLTRSPLAPAETPLLPPVAGVTLAAGNCGIRYKDRPDLLLMHFAPGTQMAGVFTRSLTAAAPIDWCKQAATHGAARALVVNAGNANAFTGAAGVEAVKQTVEATRALLHCAAEEVFVASTGVIGVPLPHAKLTGHLPQLAATLTPNDWNDAAQAILTTDTFAKAVTRTARIGEHTVTINGIAKGSGMIAPDMATMLAFIATDATLPAPVLRDCLQAANAQSFNAITVDSDTSTNDCALLFATAQVPHAPITAADNPQLAAFRAALDAVLLELAQLIVRDGEGASKFITITVTGAESSEAAHRIALSIGNSPLVKTAIAGEDANWGRIVMAVGKSGERAERDRLRLHIGGVLVAENGQVHPEYHEETVMPHMRGQHITIEVDVGVKPVENGGRATIYTCDLTHGYIDINGSYRS